MNSPHVEMTLDEAIHDVTGYLTGLDLQYTPENDTYYSTTRALNRALRLNALELEWSYYSSTESVGMTSVGLQQVSLRKKIRPRMIGDDAVTLVDRSGNARVWAYILPRDSLHKYPGRKGLWCSITKNTITFSRPLGPRENGLQIHVPVMREPRMFELPVRPRDPNIPVEPVSEEHLSQILDFDFPDIITLRAASMIALSDPILQPRAQTLDAQWTDIMYQLKERDERNTDAPYMNDFFVPIKSDLYGPAHPYSHRHPHSDERQW